MSSGKMSFSHGAGPSASSNTINGCYDPLDLDSLINYDQVRCPSPNLSPASSGSNSTPAKSSSILNSTFASSSSNQQVSAGPSHQYDLHKQQTGIPAGSLAKTLAINQPTDMSLFKTQVGFGKKVEESFFHMGGQDEFDFSIAPSHTPSFSAASDMDMDFDTPTGDCLPPFFFPEADSNDFVDPNTIGGQEGQASLLEPSGPQTTASSNTGRVWPGMHQQQAAMAKAQQQKQQKEARNTGRSTRAHPPTDPIVEERISRLLSSMRQASVGSSIDDDASSLSGHGSLPHLARMRKEEEDMDQDERLLASEEGKKLSSKERRQLRNKVSARAFRSRRKEYIGQLEGEVAARTSDANALRSQNKALLEENTRLSDLTRMLLSSSAFSSFLDDLSSGAIQPPTATDSTPAKNESARPADSFQPKSRKDPDPYAAVQQQTQFQQSNEAQVGMTLLPDTAMDFSALNINQNNAWPIEHIGSSIWGNAQPQVFSVLEVPSGPAVDQITSETLSQKSPDITHGHVVGGDEKQVMPVIEWLPSLEVMEDKNPSGGAVVTTNEESGTGDIDPVFVLYNEASRPSELTKVCDTEVAEDFQGLESEKLFSRIELVPRLEVINAQATAHAIDRFEQSCRSMDAAVQRITRATSHLGPL